MIRRRFLSVFTMLVVVSGLRAQDPAPDVDREQALEQIENVLGQDQSLDPLTRQALLDLVKLLKQGEAEGAGTTPTDSAPVSKGEVARAVDDYLDARLLDEGGGESSSGRRVLARPVLLLWRCAAPTGDGL